MVVCDIDHFKSINDTHGHQSGDAVLQHIASVLRATTRRHVDSVVRYGGEEFLLLLPQTGPDGASYVAERLRTSIAGNPTMDGAGRRIEATASFGVLSVDFSVVRGDVTETSLIAAADALLYEAKASGRNSIRSREWPGESQGQDVDILVQTTCDAPG